VAYVARNAAKIKAQAPKMLDINVSHTFLDIGISALTAMQKDFKVC